MEKRKITRKDITEIDNGHLMFVIQLREPIHLFLDEGEYLGTIEIHHADNAGKLYVRCQLDKNLVVMRDKALKNG